VARQRDDIPEAVVQVLEKMMVKEPSERFQTPGDVVEALRPFALPSEAAAEARSAGGQTIPIAPLPMADPLNDPLLALAATAAPALRPVRKAAISAWQKTLHEYRLALIGGGTALVALVLALVVLPQVMRGSRSTPDSGAWRSAEANADPPNQTQPRTPPAIGEWTDLIAQTDPQRNTVAGEWQKLDGGLRVFVAEGARIVIPVRPPAEYDFEMVFTRNSGRDSVPMFFVAGGRQASFEIDAWNVGLGGIQNINRADVRDESNPARATGQRITNGRRTTMLVSIRRDRVEGYVDGRLISAYRGDGSDLSLPSVWNLQQPEMLGVGSYMSDTTFHSIRMRPR
jgi:hypothetical protein